MTNNRRTYFKRRIISILGIYEIWCRLSIVGDTDRPNDGKHRKEEGEKQIQIRKLMFSRIPNNDNSKKSKRYVDIL